MKRWIKKILCLAAGLVAAVCIAFGQCPPPQKVNTNYQFKASGSDSALRLPTTQVIQDCWLSPGAIEYNAPDSTTYQWTGTEWISIRGAGRFGITQVYGVNHVFVRGTDTVGFDTLQYRKIFNVVSFGADTTGVTDATPGIQQAINQCWISGGGQVYFPRGNYKIAGALNPLCNCQLYIPASNLSDNRPQVTLKGESSVLIPSGYSSGGVLALPDEQVVLKSTIAGSGAFPAILAMAPGSANFSFTQVRIQDMGFESYTNHAASAPTVTPLYLFNASTAELDNVFAGLDTTNQMSQDPSGNEVAGIVIGHIGNGGPNLLTNVYAAGFKYGVVLSDHSVCKGVQAYACTYGYAFPRMDFTVLGDVLHVACRYGLYWPTEGVDIMGATGGPSTIDMHVEAEIDSVSGLTGSFWYNSLGNIVDSGNNAFGYARYRNVEGGTATNLDNRVSQIPGDAVNNLTIVPATLWGPGNVVLQSIDSFTLGLFQNLHFDRTSALFTYINDGPGATYVSNNGDQYYRAFPSGTAGSTIGLGSAVHQFFLSHTGNMGVGTETPDPSAKLDIESTTQGLLPPQLSTLQKLAIPSPAAGLLVYDTTLNQMSYFNGTAWVNF